jgi:hypothetical protein
MTLSLLGNGNLLRIDITIILRNVTLQGHSTNDKDVVAVYGSLIVNSGKIFGNNGRGVLVGNGGIFTMNGGEISGNTTTYGGGVSVMYGGTFIMNGGGICGNTATGSEGGGGGGVVVGGTFTMNGGEISGNTATSGGGVRVMQLGTFRISYWVIYGSNAAGNFQNTASYGAALYREGGTTAERGNGSPWVKAGDLSTTDNTIRIVGGAMWQ